MIHTTDLDLADRDISGLTSADALATFLAKLGYETGARQLLTPEAIGLTGESAATFRAIELLAEDDDEVPLFQVIFAQPKSLTAKARNDLARVLGKTNLDYLLILASDFEDLEFVLLDKSERGHRRPTGVHHVKVIPRTISVNRRHPTRLDLRNLRRLTWTCQDGVDQVFKLRHVFATAAYTGVYFQNRTLFADYYLEHRLRDDPAWRDNPTEVFPAVQDLLRDGRTRWQDQAKQVVREQLFEPLFRRLGFRPVVQPPNTSDSNRPPDYRLEGAAGTALSVAFVYPWDRWLDGPDVNDGDSPEENPGAFVVAALDGGTADWIIVTNGQQWRLYSRHAHARATSFYEVDLVEALMASGETDPNEAFRYWWLFFRSAAYQAGTGQVGAGCWLDTILQGSRDYAKQLGEKLKKRIFYFVFKDLAAGFLADWGGRLGRGGEPTEQELADVFEATLTLLYRLLFLLYAESRDLLPVREAPYQAASLKKIKEEVAGKAGVALDDVSDRLQRAYSASETGLYHRLGELFAAMDKGDCARNVPTYNGGLFNTSPDDSDQREQRMARFLKLHKVPDLHLALAIDRLSRDQDERTLGLVFIDYKSLEVRHLGSIYEGLLEFKLILADEDKTTQAEKGQERYISLSQAKVRRGRSSEVVVRKGEVYLSNDKAERKASGSYYTPDPIVEYIVAQAVGPVIEEKLEALRPDFREARKTFDRYVANEKARPSPGVDPKEKESVRRFAAEKTYNTHKDLVERLFDLKVLDPAMGSGHFLVEAVDFITDRLLTFLSSFPINPVGFLLDRMRRDILRSLATGQQLDIYGDVDEVARDRDNPWTRRLTDINLLKRHILKRCIYGVDLNPMAVELAKVSLWLDAFTLGAPLNFLDHHLRPGNALVGLSIGDLEAVAGDRFHIRKIREQLRPAIETMLQVSRMADATAAEAAKSAALYQEVRAGLSGARLALDLLVAQDFGAKGAAGLVAEGDDLDFTNRDRLLASLHDAEERRVVAEAERLARDRGLHFFHWDLEFPEVFFGTSDDDLRRLRHSARLAPGSKGFNAVVGNPPYVRMELIKPLKPFLKPHFRCHAERADLFIYFYERAVQLLQPGGRTAFIASSTWTKTKAGESLRAFLKAETTLDSFLDFGDLPVFEDATTYPCILVTRRQPPPPDQVVASTVVNDLEATDLARYLHAHTVAVPQAQLELSGWHFEDRLATRLRDKIRAAGVALNEYCGSSPLRGIVTGLNEAFVIDTPTRDRLVAEDHKSAEILKPFLEGKDLKTWRAEWRGLWLIYTHDKIDFVRYPAIRAYLATYRPQLERRAKSDKHEWYELQQPQFAFTPCYQRPKIFYPHFSHWPTFSFDPKGFFGNDKTYCIPVEDSYLLGVLNSPVIWYIVRATCSPKRGGWYEMRVQYIEKMPIVRPSDSDRRAIGSLAERLSIHGVADRLAVESELFDRVARVYGLNREERDLIELKAGATLISTVNDEE